MAWSTTRHANRDGRLIGPIACLESSPLPTFRALTDNTDSDIGFLLHFGFGWFHFFFFRFATAAFAMRTADPSLAPRFNAELATLDHCRLAFGDLAFLV